MFLINRSSFLILNFSFLICICLPVFAQKKYAVVVGVADYRKPGMDLRYSDDDAYRFYAYLLSCKGGGALDDENVACLIDEAATKENILQTMDKVFSKAGPDDMLVFYFSGHGSKGAFCPTDTGDGYSSLLNYEEIKAVFKKHPAKYKICLADACFSGKIFEGQPEAVSGGGPASNVVIMMSSDASETSQENPKIRQGAFSYYLLKGLRGAADRDNNGKVTLEEVFPYIKANVLNFTQKKQTPVIEGNAPPEMVLSVTN